MNSYPINYSSSILPNIIFPILETMQLPIAVIEPKYDNKKNLCDFSYIFINDFCCKTYFLIKEDIVGKTLSEIFPSFKENKLFDKLKSIYENDRELSEEFISDEGSITHPFHTTISFYASKFENYILMNWVDTTVLQNQLKAIKLLQNSNVELEQFAYIASHDLQEPIRMVISFTQLLQKRYANQLDDDAKEFITFAVDGAQRMKLLIDNLLIYSRANISGKIELVSVDSVIKNIQEDFKILINETGIKFIYKDLPEIYTDASLLSRLFTNLISNAIKFRRKDNPVVEISAERNNSEWIFSVSDNGIGIDEKYFEKIFMIFQKLHGKTEYPGTGLGLAICKRIAEKLGGTIWLKSQPYKGATFYFTIPIKGTDNVN